MIFPPEILQALKVCPFADLVDLWEAIANGGREAERELCRVDRYYLLCIVLNRPDALHPWLYDRCREVEAYKDGYLDIWAREHYKSTVITFAGSIQEMILDANITIGLFSHTKGISRKFFTQIKEELETNQRLKDLFPEIFWQEPRKEAPRWSEEKGIVVKRSSNAKEATVEAWGLVDGQPTSAHFALRIYDDVVTRESVSTPDQIKKTTDAWELSDNLGARQENGMPGRAWHAGTRYHFGDTYYAILERKALKPRIHAATVDGTPNGKPILLTQEAWTEKKTTQGAPTIACQMLCNPAAGTEAMFNKDHLRFTDIRPSTLNIYIMADPASSKKKGSDATAIAVIAVDAQRNKYLIDGYRHKMNLQERWTAINGLRKHWVEQPGIQSVYVGYERYGMRSDIEYFEEKMQAQKMAFEIKELAWPTEGLGSKYDRIQRLYPDCSQGRFFLIEKNENETSNQRKMRDNGQAWRILKPIVRRDHEGALYSLNKGFLDEYLVYPFSVHDDLIDACSRIYDMDYMPPIIIDERNLEPEYFIDGN